MDDSKIQGVSVPQAAGTPGESATPTPAPTVPEKKTTVEDQSTEKPNQDGQPNEAVKEDRTVPLETLKSERAKLREAQRELAKLKGRSQLEGYDPETTEKVLQHPLVQKLMIDNAKRDVTDFAKDYLDKEYPKFPSVIKKAILRNVRGFINEDTTDPETAKEDVRQYIDDVWAEAEAEKASTTTPSTPQPTIPVVTPSNTGGLPQTNAVKPKEVQDILNKPVTDWTDEEIKKIEQYSSTIKK